jgi:hypothetical protein
MLSAVQASHQKMGWTVAKVDIKSQEAYELAVQGQSPETLSLIHYQFLSEYPPPPPSQTSTVPDYR